MECKAVGICEDEPDCVSKHCRNCLKCNSVCQNFEKEICRRFLAPPYVCNGCDRRHNCSLEKRLYDAVKAEKEYRAELSQSREGFNMTEEELSSLEETVSPRIRHGQSICHIVSSCKNELTVSESTVRRLVKSCVLTVRAIDLPRTVRFKPRKGKPKELKIDRNCRTGRTYEDYQKFIELNQDILIAEMDSVIGNVGGSVLLTVIIRSCNFMLAFKRERNNAQSVIDIFSRLYSLLPENVYRSLFGLILTDNGSEFTNPTAIEAIGDTRIFYCKPSAPYQKGKVENNHEFIRRFVPKGNSFDCYSQDDIDLMMSHINSYGRPQFNNVSPTELFIRIYGEDVLHLLRQTLIPPEEIILNPSIFR